MTNTGTLASEPVKKKRKFNWPYPGKKAHSYDYKWVSMYWYKWNKPRGINFRIGPGSYFDNRFHIALCLGWFSLYINLPIYSTWDDCECPEYGLYYHSNALVLCWNMKKKFIYMPWELKWVRTSKLRTDGTWYTEVPGMWKKWQKENPNANISKQWEAEKEMEGELWSETHHYYYKTKYGDEQNDVDATITVEEREWRPKWFKWTKLFAKVRKSIDVKFSNEVGSERGSWKGGCTGCGYTMKPGETPYDTLMRMQRERSFDR